MMALLPSNPAIDAGDNAGAPMWDQRGEGFYCIVNGTIDIGASKRKLVPLLRYESMPRRLFPQACPSISP